jgi:hypothetical protein
MSLLQDAEELKRKLKDPTFQALSDDEKRKWFKENVGVSEELKTAYKNEDLWEQLRGQIPSADSLQLEFGTDVKPYETGDAFVAPEEQFLNQRMAQNRGLQSQSAMQGETSAYDELGKSAFDVMDASVFKDLGFDPNRMGESQDYFSSVMQDPVDDIAEADYARRQAQAEQLRRSHSEAALAEQEMRGQGGAGDRILSELSGNQAMAGDMYQAGLDANAVGQQRRDSAAGAFGDISERIARGHLAADTSRASGLDAFGANRAAGIDAYGTNVASGQDAFTANSAGALDDWANQRYEDYYGVGERNADRGTEAAYENWTRSNTVSDANTDAANDTTRWNKIDAPQQYFGNLGAITAGQSGQLADLANWQAKEPDEGEEAWKNLGKVAKVGGKAVKALGGGGGIGG